MTETPVAPTFLGHNGTVSVDKKFASKHMGDVACPAILEGGQRTEGLVLKGLPRQSLLEIIPECKRPACADTAFGRTTISCHFVSFCRGPRGAYLTAARRQPPLPTVILWGSCRFMRFYPAFDGSRTSCYYVGEVYYCQAVNMPLVTWVSNVSLPPRKSQAHQCRRPFQGEHSEGSAGL